MYARDSIFYKLYIQNKDDNILKSIDKTVKIDSLGTLSKYSS